MSKNLVRPTSKWQVTLPSQIRKQLGLNIETFLDVTLDAGRIVLTPVKIKSESKTRLYSDNEIEEFLKEDELSEDDAKFFEQVLDKK